MLPCVLSVIVVHHAEICRLEDVWEEFAQHVLQAEQTQDASEVNRIEVCNVPVTILECGDDHVLVLLAAACCAFRVGMQSSSC